MGFPMATVVLCVNFTLHGFGLKWDGSPYPESEFDSAYVNKP